jgi:hypothetical protein
MRDFIDEFVDVFVQLPVRVLLANLPRRLWGDRVTPGIAGASAIVLGLIGGSLGAFGYLGFMPTVAVMKLVAGPGRASAMAPFTFAFGTPVGLTAVYLSVTAIIRGAAAYVDDPIGDPTLTLVDGIIHRRRVAAATARVKAERDRIEGPDVPDRLVDAKAAGFSGADFIVIASRRKADWSKGTFVVTGDKWYRVLDPVEQQTPAGLRTLYPLAEINDLEVMRKWVEYELPPVTRVPKWWNDR